MNKVTSKDGTSIAFDKTGQGPTLILVAAALSERSETEKLAKLLSPHFTVINYDRRGRGASGNTVPYAVEREVEDIEALIDAANESAYLFGSSSGAVLALEAANKLGNKVKGLFMYEPPFILDDSHPPVPDELIGEIDKLVATNQRNEAVKVFFNKVMGIPVVFVTMMRWFMPGWSKMAAIAHTIPYDLKILAGTQTGKPLPTNRWTSVQAPTLVVVGSKSEAFFHNGAKALADLLPNTQYHALEGGNHGTVVMNPKALVPVLVEFFLENRALEGKQNRAVA